jgi:hypothetical protein
MAIATVLISQHKVCQVHDRSPRNRIPERVGNVEWCKKVLRRLVKLGSYRLA